jgi:hypothetical protein
LFTSRHVDGQGCFKRGPKPLPEGEYFLDMEIKEANGRSNKQTFRFKIAA